MTTASISSTRKPKVFFRSFLRSIGKDASAGAEQPEVTETATPEPPVAGMIGG